MQWAQRLCLCAILVGACATRRQVSVVERVSARESSIAAAPTATGVARDEHVPAQQATLEAGTEPLTRSSRPLDRVAVERLVEDARTTDSDELVIVKDGDLVGHWDFTDARTPIDTMSITKSVLSLAVGTLVDRGELRVEQPVHELYPEWREGKKREVTLLQLLTHTSGLDEGDRTRDIYAHRNFVEFTLRTKLVYDPGTHYRYSNRGANLVSGLVTVASGMRADRYVAKVLFEPMGIRRYAWARDGAGQPQGLAGLRMLPRDLAKMGELVVDGGVYDGRRIVSAEWLRRCMLPGPVQPSNKRLGLFWWLIPEWTRVTVDDAIVRGWRDAAVDEAFVTKVEPLVGRRFDSVVVFVQALRELFGDPELADWNENTWKRGLADAHFEFGPIVGAYSAGTAGQYLVILPRDRLVAVRMRRAPRSRVVRGEPQRTWPDFVERVQALVHDTR